jgi:cytoskeleton protein RodZ
MDSIGNTLRRERVRRGLKLEEIAAQTKIGQYHLRALEENQFDRLPGGLFRRSFLRQYAQALELNADEIIASFKQQFEPPSPRSPEPPPTPPHLTPLPMFAWFLVAVVACAGAYSVWENARRSLSDAFAVAPRPAAHGAGVILNPSSPRAGANRSQPDHSSVEEPPPVRWTASPQESPRGAAAMHVMFAATEPVWLAIKSDGNRTYSGTLEELQRMEFDASEKMTVLVGNAGGLAISLNGEPVALAASHGEVQLLVLTPAGVQVLSRTRSVR